VTLVRVDGNNGGAPITIPSPGVGVPASIVLVGCGGSGDVTRGGGAGQVVSLRHTFTSADPLTVVLPEALAQGESGDSYQDATLKLPGVSDLVVARHGHPYNSSRAGQSGSGWDGTNGLAGGGQNGGGQNNFPVITGGAGDELTVFSLLSVTLAEGGTAYSNSAPVPHPALAPNLGTGGNGGDGGDGGVDDTTAQIGSSAGFYMWYGPGVAPPGANDLTLTRTEHDDLVVYVAQGHGMVSLPPIPRGVNVNVVAAGAGGGSIDNGGGGGGEVLRAAYTATQDTQTARIIVPHAPPRYSAEPAWNTQLFALESTGTTALLDARPGNDAGRYRDPTTFEYIGGENGAGERTPGNFSKGGTGAGGRGSTNNPRSGGPGVTVVVPSLNDPVASYQFGQGGDGLIFPSPDAATIDGALNSGNGGTASSNSVDPDALFSRGGGGAFVLWYSTTNGVSEATGVPPLVENPPAARYVPVPPAYNFLGVSLTPRTVTSHNHDAYGRRQKLRGEGYAALVWMATHPLATRPEDLAYAARHGVPVPLLAALRVLPTPVSEDVFTWAQDAYGLEVPAFHPSQLM